MDEIFVCRLCLKVLTDKSFITLEDKERTMLKMIFPTLIQRIKSDAKICYKCSQDMLSTYEFKSNCIKYYKGSQFYLKSSSSEVNECLQMMEKCLPELDIKFISNLSSCKICRDSLKRVFRFINCCLETEENVKSFFSSETKNDEYLDGHDFPECPQTICEKIEVEEDDIFNKIDVEETELYNSVPTEVNFEGTSEFIESKEKSSSQDETNFNIKIEFSCEEEPVNVLNYISSSEPKIQSDKDSTGKNGSVKNHLGIVAGSRTHKCTVCGYVAKTKNILFSHALVHKTEAEETMYKCNLCAFRTKRKTSLYSHLLRHKRSFQKAKCKTDPDAHMATHGAVSKPPSFKCDKCSFDIKH